MAQLFLMPQPGSTMEEGTILKWRKREGDSVAKGEILLEIETDKATVEIEAEADGILRKILAPESAVVPVREPIAILGTADEPIDALLAQAGGDSASAAPQAVPSAPVSTDDTPMEKGAVLISPRARRAADSYGIPVRALTGRGTGAEGRVVERDVVAYWEAQKAQPALAAATSEKSAPRLTPLAARMADDLGVDVADLALGLPGSRVRSEDVRRHAETRQAPSVSPDAAPTQEDITIQPLAGMRKRIAENIVKSAFTAPHVTLTLEVDMTETVAFRARLLPEVEKAFGARLSYTDILVKAVARALDDHPMLNAALVGDEVRIYAQKNIGVAVALDEGLVVPVVRAADKKSLGTLSVELKQLVERVRAGKFTPDDLSGGTFSITNLGSFGIDAFTPIIVPPQAAILGVGRIAEKPVVFDKQVTARSMMVLSLSFDHRVLDGAPAARFLQRLQQLLESPYLILL